MKLHRNFINLLVTIIGCIALIPLGLLVALGWMADKAIDRTFDIVCALWDRIDPPA